ncbi:MAG: Tat pathway signal protein, partial [Acidobacteria bacterium]|nr:Tat pathway signal protein [Acidobacteriota bacterium]
MNSGSVAGQARTFRDYREILNRSEMALLDHQARHEGGGFEANAATGKLVHGVLGWGKLMPESMAQYQTGPGYYRAAAKPAVEARLWMLEGIAGGIQPWWHHVGAALEDRRALATAEPVMRWHEENERYLINRRPVATVGLVWSQRNVDFYGRDSATERTEQPYNGWMRALVRARIPWVSVHVADIEREAPGLAVLILPNLAAMSDEQCEAVRKFARRGGAVIATGVTSLFTELGDRRPDFALADLFGVHANRDFTQTGASLHTYLRIEGADHPVLAGFNDTAILGFGGSLADLRVDEGVQSLLTFIPAYPAYPPETAWMRTAKTDIPGMVVRGRVLFLPADVDRRYARDLLPDHARLLANAVRWAAGGRIPLAVDGPGLLDCNLYEQSGRLILHLVNLT